MDGQIDLEGLWEFLSNEDPPTLEPILAPPNDFFDDLSPTPEVLENPLEYLNTPEDFHFHVSDDTEMEDHVYGSKHDPILLSSDGTQPPPRWNASILGYGSSDQLWTTEESDQEPIIGNPPLPEQQTEEEAPERQLTPRRVGPHASGGLRTRRPRMSIREGTTFSFDMATARAAMDRFQDIQEDDDDSDDDSEDDDDNGEDDEDEDARDDDDDDDDDEDLTLIEDFLAPVLSTTHLDDRNRAMTVGESSAQFSLSSTTPLPELTPEDLDRALRENEEICRDLEESEKLSARLKKKLHSYGKMLDRIVKGKKKIT